MVFLIIFDGYEIIENSPGFSVCIYNPFADVKILCSNMTKENGRMELNRLQRFIKDRKNNLNGYRLKVSIFPFVMVSKQIFNKQGQFVKFAGQDGENLDILSRTMNFTYDIISTNISYGYQLKNMSFVGK